jgi:hypothetical protein
MYLPKYIMIYIYIKVGYAYLITHNYPKYSLTYTHLVYTYLGYMYLIYMYITIIYLFYTYLALHIIYIT